MLPVRRSGEIYSPFQESAVCKRGQAAMARLALPHGSNQAAEPSSRPEIYGCEEISHVVFLREGARLRVELHDVAFGDVDSHVLSVVEENPTHPGYTAGVWKTT